jgi:naringenin degradation protein FdeB
MFEYFPGNYVWNLSFNIAWGMGGNIGELDVICRKITGAGEAGGDAGTEAFFEAFREQADQLVALADEDIAAGHHRSASRKYRRAWAYYFTCERMQHREYAPRKAVYRKALDTFSKSVEYGQLNCLRVEIPHQGTHLAGLFVKAIRSDSQAAPCVLLLNGLDSTKEMLFGIGIQDELARRGISSIAVDQPGSGEAIRLQKLPAIIESEVWAASIADYLETRDDVNKTQLGVCAWSLGGYYAPRVAAFEKRFKLCAVWGANYNWGEMQKRRLASEGENPVPHYWDHVQWVWGKETMEDFMAYVPGITLEGVVEKINVPFLVTHGVNDRQIPVEYAHAQYNNAVNSPKRELKIFTEREGGVEHCGADNTENVIDHITDWISETFQELGAEGLST